jgi:hypothetical protein
MLSRRIACILVTIAIVTVLFPGTTRAAVARRGGLRPLSKRDAYFLGAAFAGYPLTGKMRQFDRASVAGPARTPVNQRTYVYGDCTPDPTDEEGGCTPPVAVITQKGCTTDPGGHDYPAGLNGVSLTVRGVPARYYDWDNRLDIYTGDVQITIYGPDQNTVMEAANNLQHVKPRADDPAPGAPLPAPTAALLACSYVALDDFSDDTTDSTFWTSIVQGSKPTIAQTRGELQITFPADSAVESDFGAEYRSLCKLRGDFDLSVDFRLIAWPDRNGVRIGVGVYADQGAGTGNFVERVSFSSLERSIEPHEVYLTDFRTDGVQGIRGTSDQSGTLRIRRSGDKLSGFYRSQPSGDWIHIHSWFTSVTDVNFGLRAWSHRSSFAGQRVQIGFDNFRVTNGLVNCGNLPPLAVRIAAGPISNPDNGHDYFLLEASSWTDAEAAAVVLGGHLATIRNQAEQDWVYSTFAAYGGLNRSLWIGLNDAASEGTFVWVSGEPVTYSDWGGGEPNNSGGIEDYVHMWCPNSGAPGRWNDLSNSGAPCNSPATPPNGVAEVPSK